MPHIGHLKADILRHTGLVGVAAGNGHRLGIHIAAPDIIGAVELLVPGLVLGLLPAAGGNEGPILRGKGSLQARRAVTGDQRRLDGNGAAAAEGITEGIPAPVAGQLYQRRRQRLPQGRLHAYGPVAPLVQSLAAGIQRQQHLILEQGEPHLIPGAGLRELLQMIGGTHPLHHGLLDDALAGGHRVKLGGDGIALHRKGGVAGQIVLPCHGPGTLKQFLEAAGAKLRQHQHHPCAAAQVDVQPGAILQCAAAQHPAVLRPHVLQSQTLDLVAYQFFQPQQTGDHICIHLVTSNKRPEKPGVITYQQQYTESCRKAQGKRQKIIVEDRRGIVYNRNTRESRPDGPCKL